MASGPQHSTSPHAGRFGATLQKSTVHESGTPVWRYMSLDALIAIVRDRQLRFTRVDKFEDPFERAVPKQTIDNQVLLFGSACLMKAV
jgi:hypothetical protein